jgi:hypothetical protein
MEEQVDRCAIYATGIDSADELAELVAASTQGMVDGLIVTTPGGVESDVNAQLVEPEVRGRTA